MMVERPFAYCCAEGGGRVEACDCVNKNHGTARFDIGDIADSPPAFSVSLRDWFAGGIANGMAAHSGTMGMAFGPGDIAQRSYEIADAMLAERMKPATATAEPPMQHVAYFDEGEFYWMSGIKPRACELFAAPAEPSQ